MGFGIETFGGELAAAFRRLGVTPPESDRAAIPDREQLRRLAADQLGLPTAPFWFADSVDELFAVTAHAGLPLVVNPLSPAGTRSVLLRPEDVEPGWHRAVAEGPGRVLAETVVEIDHEVTVLTVRGAGGQLTFCESIGHRQVDGVLEAWQPQQLSQIAIDAARSIAARVVSALGGMGVFCVELLVRGDEVYFSDVASGPTGPALVTVCTQRLSVFDLHARAVLGLPVDAIMVSPGAVEVVSVDAMPAADDLGQALRVPESDVRLFTPNADCPGGTGVALATGPDVISARDRVRQMSGALWGRRELR